MYKALLIIDVQNFYFEEGPDRLYEPEKAANQIKKVLEYFRKNNQTVIHIQHVGKELLEAETLDHIFEIHESVAPIHGETVVRKAYPSSFRETKLKQILDELQIKELIIVGMKYFLLIADSLEF